MAYKVTKGFTKIAVSGQDDVDGEVSGGGDTLTLVAGSNVTITTDASADSVTIASSGGGGSSDSIADADGDTKIQVEESSDDDVIRFDTAGTERMVITAAGKVGVGTNAPGYQLDLTGDIRVRGGDIRDNSGNPAVQMDGSANVTIPNALTVAGTTALNGVTYTWPDADGSSGQQLQTNGSGTLSWAAAGSGSGIASLAADSTPQLGGDLDVNGKTITSASNGDIELTPNGSGNVILDGQKWPQADGSNGQTLQTNGSGQLSWATASGGGSSESSVSLSLEYDHTAFDLGTNSYTAKTTTLSNLTIPASKTVTCIAFEVTEAFAQNSGTPNGEVTIKIGDVWYKPQFLAESYGYLSQSNYWIKNSATGILGFVSSRQAIGGSAVNPVVSVKGATNDTSNSGGYINDGTLKITIYYT
jgi:hypothetical protein